MHKTKVCPSPQPSHNLFCGVEETDLLANGVLHFVADEELPSIEEPGPSTSAAASAALESSFEMAPTRREEDPACLTPPARPSKKKKVSQNPDVGEILTRSTQALEKMVSRGEVSKCKFATALTEKIGLFLDDLEDNEKNERSSSK